MAISEFELIRRYFERPGLTGSNAAVSLGIGDDCALLQVPPGYELAVSMDLLLNEVHFPSQAPAGLLAQRALAVNLSDLAAMGAVPLAMTLGLSLPAADEVWLEQFSQGLEQAVQNWACPLIGGDITRGPLMLAIQVHGQVARGLALTRSGARPGDRVYVSGALGAAGLALKLLDYSLALNDEDADLLEEAYYRPQPRLALGQAAAGLASAAIDVSDGLLADVAHIARQSQVGIRLQLSAIPVAQVVRRVLQVNGREQEAMHYALTAGDDYELVMTVAADKEDQLLERSQALGIPLTGIGEVYFGQGVQCMSDDGQVMHIERTGYRHFE